MVIARLLEHFVINTDHHKYPGQAGILAFAQLIWFLNILLKLVAEARYCIHCNDKVKSMIPKENLGTLPELNEPNEEDQMDSDGSITNNNTTNNYLLITVDRLSKYPLAECSNHCHKKSAIDYLELYCKTHCIPMLTRCAKAQAFKSREFQVFCKNKNIKLVLAPAGDHRGKGMVERLI